MQTARQRKVHSLSRNVAGLLWCRPGGGPAAQLRQHLRAQGSVWGGWGHATSPSSAAPGWPGDALSLQLRLPQPGGSRWSSKICLSGMHGRACVQAACEPCQHLIQATSALQTADTRQGQKRGCNHLRLLTSPAHLLLQAWSQCNCVPCLVFHTWCNRCCLGRVHNGARLPAACMPCYAPHPSTIRCNTWERPGACKCSRNESISPDKPSSSAAASEVTMQSHPLPDVSQVAQQMLPRVGCLAGHACKLHASYATHHTQAPGAATPGKHQALARAMKVRPLTSQAHVRLQARPRCNCVPRQVFPSGSANAAWVECTAGRACKLHVSPATASHPSTIRCNTWEILGPARAVANEVASPDQPSPSAAASAVTMQLRRPLPDVSQVVQQMLHE